jgi:hypothetical protein
MRAANRERSTVKKATSTIFAFGAALALVLVSAVPASAASFATTAVQYCTAPSKAYLTAKSTGNLNIHTYSTTSGSTAWSNGAASIQRTRNSGYSTMYSGSFASTTAAYFANAYPGCTKIA